MYAVFRPLIYILSILSLMIVLWFGSRNVFDEIISVGTLYISRITSGHFLTRYRNLQSSFRHCSHQLHQQRRYLRLWMRMNLFLRSKIQSSRIKSPEKLNLTMSGLPMTEKTMCLRMSHLSLIRARRWPFVGATGAGKSSILNLIGRYYDIQKGHIYIDGIDIRQFSKKQLRSAIGQMQQDVFIFEGDVAYNIRLNDNDITDEQVKEAAEYVNASHFIEKLPQGYHEPVTERGATFSAGERQLLSFARTLAHNPSILVMDEATANIDTETEILIQEALEKLMDGRTTIMVAHRLSTIQHADCIMVMHKGRICERGTHRELLEQDGIYRKLYELQIS